MCIRDRHNNLLPLLNVGCGGAKIATSFGREKHFLGTIKIGDQQIVKIEGKVVREERSISGDESTVVAFAQLDDYSRAELQWEVLNSIGRRSLRMNSKLECIIGHTLNQKNGTIVNISGCGVLLKTDEQIDHLNNIKIRTKIENRQIEINGASIRNYQDGTNNYYGVEFKGVDESIQEFIIGYVLAGGYYSCAE